MSNFDLSKSTIVIDADNHDTRADVAISNLSDFSRSAVKQLINKDLISSNRGGEKVKLDPDSHVFEGDEIFIVKPSKERNEIEVLHKEGDFVVFNKPAGVLSQPKSESLDDEWTILDEAEQLLGDDALLVHRLDRVTSGVLIASANEDVKGKLQKQFQEKSVTKQYVAITDGIIEQENIKIEWPILRDPKKGGKFSVNPRGRVAITNLKKRLASNGYSAVLLRPETGRTHQLRVHLSNLGHPIYGDKLYGSINEVSKIRIMLHAYSLKISYGSNSHHFIAPIPNDMRDLSQTLGLEIGELVEDNDRQ